MASKWKRIAPGIYAHADDSAVTIERDVNPPSGCNRAAEICWQVFINGKAEGWACPTLRDAKLYAQSRIVQRH